MTTPRYRNGCSAGSKAYRDTSDPSNVAFVNFNNGNVNWNDANNSGLLRLVRLSPARECQGVTLKELHAAWRRTRRGKKPSQDQTHYETRWIEHLMDDQERLNAGTWRPAPCRVSVAARPKAREIHAPAFCDRVIHHAIVPRLEAIYEPIFIHDSYSNRKDRGTNAAVERLLKFSRQVHSGQGGGWALKLDVWNCFNSMWRKKLWAFLKARMQKCGIPEWVQRAVHALLCRPPLSAGAHYVASKAERALVPWHKRLENALRGCGITIGNLSSQFFANVYFNALDQFIKHVLRVKRYIRYVDDFVLIHRSREQLLAWKEQIRQFLRAELRMELKDEGELTRLEDGVDFLGYVVRPSHITVRRRVVSHAREKLSDWERRHIRHSHASATPAEYRQLRDIWMSYSRGHFSHASSFRLRQGFHRRYPWLHQLGEVPRSFHERLEGRHVAVQLVERGSI